MYALVVMTFPTIWASVLLDRLPTELGSLAAACTRLGVDATPTREGWLALPGGFTPVLPDLLWIGDPHDPAGAIALHDAAVRAQARTVFAAPALFDDPGASGDVASITMHGALEGPRRAMTVGLARLPRAEGPVELITTSPALSAHAGFALGQVAALLAANPDALGPYHRVAIETLAPAGLAGVVIWPSGHLQLGGRVIALWELLPITHEELAAFRAGGQEAWMDHVEDTNGFEALQVRWCGAR